jgi:hypothetical protein
MVSARTVPATVKYSRPLTAKSKANRFAVNLAELVHRVCVFVVTVPDQFGVTHSNSLARRRLLWSSSKNSFADMIRALTWPVPMSRTPDFVLRSAAQGIEQE